MLSLFWLFSGTQLFNKTWLCFVRNRARRPVPALAAGAFHQALVPPSTVMLAPVM
jgi:hypothetical protein